MLELPGQEKSILPQCEVSCLKLMLMRVLWGSWEIMGPFSALGGLSLSDQGPRELGSDQSSSKPVASESIVTLGQRMRS